MSHTEAFTPPIELDPRPASAKVGMVGDGQLARMTQQAAIGLNVELLVLTEDLDSPAVRAGATPVLGSSSNLQDLLALAQVCDVITFDHELADPVLIAQLEEHAVVRPRSAALRTAQDKLHARTLFGDEGFPVPAFSALNEQQEIADFANQHGWPVVIKARSGGYDGKGVWIANSLEEAEQVWAVSQANGLSLFVEQLVDIEVELAVLVARRPNGMSSTYEVLHTRQQDAVCREVVAPAEISPDVAAQARQLAQQIANSIGAVGLVAVELFATPNGLVLNELALRPHNSGHLTIDACATSQFEQHLRAILDWPLGDTSLLAPAAAMVNLLGGSNGSDPSLNVSAALEVPQAKIHLYAKTPRRGRKLGHVSALGENRLQALNFARKAAEALQ